MLDCITYIKTNINIGYMKQKWEKKFDHSNKYKSKDTKLSFKGRKSRCIHKLNKHSNFSEFCSFHKNDIEVLISGSVCSRGQSVVTQFMNVVVRVTKQGVRKARLEQVHRQEWRCVDDQIQKDVNAFTIFHVFFGSFLRQPKRKKIRNVFTDLTY